MMSIVWAALLVILAARCTHVLSFSQSARISSFCRQCGRSFQLHSALGPVPSAETTGTDMVTNAVNDLAAELLKTCSDYGQVGSKLTDDQRSTIDNLASSIAPFSDPAPAEIILGGTHELIYSASPSGSSGAIGPFVGKVTQSFLDDVRFINRVEFFGGAIKIELNAERKVLNESKIRVMFKETAFYVFGKEVKRGAVKGSGVWDYLYSGSVTVDGEKMLLRVMKTPSTFVIVQKE